MYIKRIFYDIQILVTKVNDEENLHDVRKKLKDVKTITGLLKELRPEGKKQSWKR